MKMNVHSRLLLVAIALICVTWVGSDLSAQQQGEKRSKAKPQPIEEGYVKKEVRADAVHGRTALSLPTPTERGDWYGTWLYVNRDIHFALWIDEKEGQPIFKLRYLGAYLTPETFETDWTGTTTYKVQNNVAEFKFLITDFDDDQISADWSWSIDLKGSGRDETSKISIYRAGDGRRLVMHFTEFNRRIQRAGQTVIHDHDQAWTFVKVSKRLARWEELPI